MYFCKHNNGLELAEYDLNTRGPGEIFGENQSGRPDLKMASLLDPEIIKLARMAAPAILSPSIEKIADFAIFVSGLVVSLLTLIFAFFAVPDCILNIF